LVSTSPSAREVPVLVEAAPVTGRLFGKNTGNTSCIAWLQIARTLEEADFVDDLKNRAACMVGVATLGKSRVVIPIRDGVLRSFAKVETNRHFVIRKTHSTGSGNRLRGRYDFRLFEKHTCDPSFDKVTLEGKELFVMIFDILANADRYNRVHPRFAECFAFLRNADLVNLPMGKHSLGDTGCQVIVGEATPKTREIAQLEGHRKFIDIQYMVSGEEMIGYVSRARCSEKPYDEARDFQELSGPAEYLTLRPGSIGIYFPEDGHQPGVETGSYQGIIRKIVIKVPVV
jgi:biofilm protein TabA